jgi:tRNA 5-methylaminomethyl-2-thiouridine biosynthesis bifunctional protein
LTEPVEWLADGTPRSSRFGDIYRSSSGGLAQARHVFLRGCALPQAWAGAPQWVILETGFGLGLNFLATWRAWQQDAQRPRLLHFVSIEAWPVAAADLLRSAQPYPELQALASALAAQWHDLTPGTHRLEFERGRVLLTLHVRDVKTALREPRLGADGIFLDGFDPQRNPAMWELSTLKAVARHCKRGTRLATWSVAGPLRRDLAQCGFSVEKAPGLAPKRDCLKAVFAPAWEPKGQGPARTVVTSHCVVVGAGLAGAAVAASLARRGWHVTVLDRGDAPASGASSLPVGLLAPNISADDNLLSRLTRSGLRITSQHARTLLRDGADFRLAGVMEQHGPDVPARWHEQGGWIKPAALVRAFLSQPGIEWRANAKVDRVVRDGEDWRVIGAHDVEIARAGLVVVAAALATAALVNESLPLQAVRGQISWGGHGSNARLPAFPVNGNGHLIANVPLDQGPGWFCGSTYQRGDTDLAPRAADHQHNFERLSALLPAAASELSAAFADGSVRAWTGVRCASADRRPLVGELAPGLWVSTAMGSRGLTFAPLCAELLAARLHGEPLPLQARLAQALDVARALEPRTSASAVPYPQPAIFRSPGRASAGE